MTGLSHEDRIPDRTDVAASSPREGEDRGLPAAAGGTLLAVAIMALMVMLSAAPWRPADASRSRVRLSWRALGEVVEQCRTPTEEENARLPAHMRRTEVCEGRTASFRLAVSIDGRPVLLDTIHGAGARGDRPIYVLRDIDVEPGAHDVQVTFDSLQSDATAVEPARETVFPTHLRLEARIQIAVGETVLVTYNAESRELETRG